MFPTQTSGPCLGTRLELLKPLRRTAHPHAQHLRTQANNRLWRGFRCTAGLCAIKKKKKKQFPVSSKINSYFNKYVLLTAPCSILQNYSLLHLDGPDLPQVNKTLININGINTDVIRIPLETIIGEATGVVP